MSKLKRAASIAGGVAITIGVTVAIIVVENAYASHHSSPSPSILHEVTLTAIPDVPTAPKPQSPTPILKKTGVPMSGAESVVTDINGNPYQSDWIEAPDPRMDNILTNVEEVTVFTYPTMSAESAELAVIDRGDPGVYTLEGHLFAIEIDGTQDTSGNWVYPYSPQSIATRTGSQIIK